MITNAISLSELANDFIEFLKTGSFTLLTISKNPNEADAIVLNYACSGPRSANWGDTLFSLKMRDSVFVSLKPGDRISAVLDSVLREKTSFAWASCGSARSRGAFYFFVSESKVEHGITQEVASIDATMRRHLNEAFDELIQRAHEHNYMIGIS